MVRQPYASLIAFGKKRWDFRTLDTRKRGAIVIAASRSRPVKTGDSILNQAAKSFPRGVVLACAELAYSRLVTGTEIRKMAENVARTRIGEFEFLTADSPLGEPQTDLQEIAPECHFYAWELDKVRALSPPRPLINRSYSPWTVVTLE
jgi:hypothetical protein